MRADVLVLVRVLLHLPHQTLHLRSRALESVPSLRTRTQTRYSHIPIKKECCYFSLMTPPLTYVLDADCKICLEVVEVFGQLVTVVIIRKQSL